MIYCWLLRPNTVQLSKMEGLRILREPKESGRQQQRGVGDDLARKPLSRRLREEKQSSPD